MVQKPRFFRPAIQRVGNGSGMGFGFHFPGGAICPNSIGKLAEWKVGSPGGGRLIVGCHGSWTSRQWWDTVQKKKGRWVVSPSLEFVFFFNTNCLHFCLYAVILPSYCWKRCLWKKLAPKYMKLGTNAVVRQAWCRADPRTYAKVRCPTATWRHIMLYRKNFWLMATRNPVNTHQLRDR